MYSSVNERGGGGGMMRNNSETEPLTIYQERNAQVEKTCQKYGLYSSEYEINQYQISKNSYKPPQQVTVQSIQY